MVRGSAGDANKREMYTHIRNRLPVQRDLEKRRDSVVVLKTEMSDKVLTSKMT